MVVAVAAHPWHNANVVALPFFASDVVVTAIEVAAIVVAAAVAAIQSRIRLVDIIFLNKL